ncbi:MAG TPA: hypothetical protein VFD84_11790 [Candidatus Binatia bacterium]|jgi:MFS family permease|nr:hypothetical protein [Candidatus Binatia bacterium]
MEHRLRDTMIFHGAVVFLLGLLAGFPHAFVLTGQMIGSERAWRMAHLEGVMNGLLLLVVGAIADRLVFGRRRGAILAGSLIVAGYGNVVASILAAVWNVRGLRAEGPATNLVVWVLFVAAIVGVFVGLALVAMQARRHRGGRAAARAPEPTV